MRPRKRDVYGNRVSDESTDETPPPSNSLREHDQNEKVGLDWRDFLALSVASLETFLLPVVVFVLILIGIVLGLSLWH